MGRRFIILLLAILVLAVGYMIFDRRLISEQEDRALENKEIKGAVDNAGLVEAEGVLTVRAQCTGCHSEKLVIQNRATRDGWEAMIRWMQKTQNLPDLGENEDVILDYLAENYAPERKGRRVPLEIEWYELPE